MASATTVRLTVKSTDLGSDQYVRGEVYFTYFEQSRLEHLRRLGVVPVFPPPPEAPSYFAIAETTARYFQSARFGDTLDVETRTDEIRTKAFRLAFRIVRAATGEVIAEGSSVQVWLGADRTPEPIPPAVRARFAASLADEGETVEEAASRRAE